MKTIMTSTGIFLFGLALIIVFHMIDGDGATAQPSFLLPVGHLLAILGGMSTFVALIREAMLIDTAETKIKL